MLSTLLDSNGGFYVKAKEIVLALGYKAGASAVTLHVDPERHCSLRELLSKSDITFSETLKLETCTKAELDSHWLSEAGMYQLILKCRLPIAKDLEKFVTGEVLPNLRKFGRYSMSAVEDEPPKRALEDGLMQAQIESLQEDIIENGLQIRERDYHFFWKQRMPCKPLGLSAQTK